MGNTAFGTQKITMFVVQESHFFKNAFSNTKYAQFWLYFNFPRIKIFWGFEDACNMGKNMLNNDMSIVKESDYIHTYLRSSILDICSNGKHLFIIGSLSLTFALLEI